MDDKTGIFWNGLFFLFIAGYIAYIALAILGYIELVPLHPDIAIINLPP